MTHNANNGGTPAYRGRRRRRRIDSPEQIRHSLNRRQRPQENPESEYRIDPKTGVRYEVLKPTEFDVENRPVLHVNDFNLSDLNGQADRFLSHLRVPPSEQELRKLREEKELADRKKEREYRQALREEREFLRQEREKALAEIRKGGK